MNQNAANSRCPLTGDSQLRAAANAQTAAIKKNFPSGIAQPALRALVAAGLTSLEQITAIREADLSKLHGMGPKAIGILRSALKERGLEFRE